MCEKTITTSGVDWLALIDDLVICESIRVGVGGFNMSTFDIYYSQIYLHSMQI